MSPSTSKPSEEDWLRRKDLIWHRFIHDEVSLKKLRGELRKDGLDVTESQIEYQLKKWEFKRNIKQSTWGSIDRHITKRKSEGKKSEVIHCGKRVKSSTVEKETARYRGRHISTLERLAQPRLPEPRSPSPMASDTQVIVYTPKPHSLELQWPDTLPWLNFPFVELRMLVNMRQIVNEQGEFCWQIQPARTVSMVPDTLELLRNYGSAISPPVFSELVTLFDKSMPEVYSGEHLQRVQWMLHGSVDGRFLECLKILIYYLSNNMVDLNPGIPCFNDNWTRVMTIITSCRMLDVKIDTKKLHGITITGFMENLLVAAMARAAYAAQSKDTGSSEEAMSVMKWILGSGHSPNVEYFTAYRWVSPLKLAFESGDLEWLKHLLDAGADPNFGHIEFSSVVYCRDDPVFFHMTQLLLQHRGFEKRFDSMLWGAVSNGRTQIAEMMLRYRIPQCLCSALHVAIENRANKIVEKLITQGADLRATVRQSRGLVCEHTALSEAAAVGLEQTKFVIELLKSQEPATDIAELITADVFVSAAAAGDDDTLSFLAMFGNDPANANANGITPLHAATRHNRLRACEYLFPFHSSYTPTTQFPSPLWLACLCAHENIVEFLIRQNTYDVNASVDATSIIGYVTNSFLRLIFGFHAGSILTPLEVMSSVRPLDKDGRTHKRRASNIAAMLIQAGARLTGREIFLASEDFQCGVLAELLAAGANPNARNTSKKSVLQCVVETPHLVNPHYSEQEQIRDRYTFVELLLQRGVKPSRGEVVSAIRLECLDLVNLMFTYGGKLTDTDIIGPTALEYSILSSNARIREFAERIIDTHPDIYDAGSLCAAITTGKRSIVDQLLANRPKQHKTNAMESTAIGLAAMLGDLVLLRKLLAFPQSFEPAHIPLHIKRGKKPCFAFWRTSMEKGSPLALTALGEDVETTFCELLRHGWRPDRLTWFIIAGRNHQILAQVLLDHNYRVEGSCSLKERFSWWRCINPLSGCIKHRNQELVLMLLKAGIDVNDGSTNYRSPLQLAIELGDVKMVDCLLTAGADISLECRGGIRYTHSPLQLAVELGDVEMVKFLLEAGADVNAPAVSFSGATALQFTAINGHIGLTKHLLEFGADVNAVGDTRNGRTALETAAIHGRLDILELLLTHGVLITGSRRYEYVRSVAAAITMFHRTSANLLRSTGGWSEEDERLKEAIISRGIFIEPRHEEFENGEPHYLYGDEISNDGETTWISRAFEIDDEFERAT